MCIRDSTRYVNVRSLLPPVLSIFPWGGSGLNGSAKAATIKLCAEKRKNRRRALPTNSSCSCSSSPCQGVQAQHVKSETPLHDQYNSFRVKGNPQNTYIHNGTSWASQGADIAVAWPRSIFVCRGDFLTRCLSCTHQQMESLTFCFFLFLFERYDRCNDPKKT